MNDDRIDMKTPVLIQVKSEGRITGYMSTKEFRDYMNNKSSFLPELIERFNERKSILGEPERVEQVVNAY